MLSQDGFLTGEIGDQIDSCFTYGYVDFVRAAGALGLWAQGLRSCGHLAPASSSYKLMSTLPPSHCVNNSKAMEKIIRDEKLHQKKEEERLKKQDDKPLGKILTKEKEREEKRLKKEQAAESKKRKAAEAAEAKKAAKPSGRRRKSKRGQHEDSAASDDPAADGSKAKAAKVSRTRAKGSFEDTDPPVLVKGSMFPAAYRLGFFESFNDFLDQVVCNKPALMRNKKGSVKKVLSKSLNRNDPQQETETKDFITQTAKAFGVQQASAKSDLQKLAAIGPVRKNKTVPQEKEVAMFLGFDLLLKAKLVARHGFRGDGDGPGGDDSGEAGDTGEEPWLLTNADAKSLDNVKNKILGACWTSFGQSNVWAGFFSTGLGHMYYQQEGNKALAMMHFVHLYEVKQQVDKKLVANSDDGGDGGNGGSSEAGIRQLTAWFQNLSPETVSSMDTAERGWMSTLRYIYLTPGDILHSEWMMVTPTNATEDLAFDGTLRLAAESHGSITDHDGYLVMTSFKCCTGANEHHLRFEKVEFAGLRQYVEKHNGRVRRRILLLGVYMQQDLELTPNVQLFFDSPLCTRITMRFFEEAADFMYMILPAISMKVGGESEVQSNLGVASSDDGNVDEFQTPPDDNESDAAQSNLGVASDDGKDEIQTPSDDNESNAALLSGWEWLELGQ
ncbi:unnamed protein product [Cladocopium goreaui]|uniref:Uncharacterized protein n=1 Tax=Cladocopium goreaui TaxID=2562237 RepID=A0A9P1CIM8_9DINO|nr:unnamed protein product [Cladocopium goreaui]CAI3992185.1 unnamed protein product [Cladocopium goreaui]